MLRLGYSQLYQMVAFVCWAQSLAPRGPNGSRNTRLWKHSVTVASATDLMAKDFGIRPTVAFTAGLLHDIGKLVLTEILGTTYSQLAEELGSRYPYALEIERKLAGVEHCEVGGRLLERWNVPEPVVAATRNHHNPSGAESHKNLASLVCWGNIIASDIEKRLPRMQSIAGTRSSQPGILALSKERLERYTFQVHERLKTVRAILDVND